MMLDRNEVVVGLDGSPSARAALAWAARYARFTFTDLRAVHVWPGTVNLSMAWASGFPGATGLVHDEPDQTVTGIIRRMFDATNPEPDWVLEHLVGPAGAVLVGQAERSQLLIVGTREHTGVSRLLNGSVSHYCLSHASCPVVAIPATVPTDRPTEPIRHRHDSGLDGRSGFRDR